MEQVPFLWEVRGGEYFQHDVIIIGLEPLSYLRIPQATSDP